MNNREVSVMLNGVELKKWDAADALKTVDDIRMYLSTIDDDDSPQVIASMYKDVIKALARMYNLQPIIGALKTVQNTEK